MKKTILSLLFIFISFCTLLAAIPGTKDTALTRLEKQDSIAKAEIPPIPPIPPNGNQVNYHYNVNDEVPHVAYIIPLAFFLFVIAIIAINQFFNYRRNKLRTELYMKFLEQGKEIPDNLVLEQKKPASNLKRGIILISVGVGVSIFLFADSPGSTDWTLGLIPLLIGVGYLVVHKLSGKTEANNTNA